MKNRDIEILNQLLEKFPAENKPAQTHALWASLRKTNTEIWLDTGDINAIDHLWTSEMTALTTNNTLLNQEIQKGIYDSIVKEINDTLPSNIIGRSRIVEIAFYLNALHGLRLSRKYNCRVSVELHTDMANSVDDILEYGSRFHDINPKGFIVKVPFTVAGILGARKLHELNIPVNFTLLFSARQNIITALIAQPEFSNVFLGRVQAYNDSNNLNGSDDLCEQVIYSTMYNLRLLRDKNIIKTKLIAASLRKPEQIETISGTDVYTIPPSVASKAIELLKSPIKNYIPIGYKFAPPKSLTNSNTQVKKLWYVPSDLIKLAKSINKEVPKKTENLKEQFDNAGYSDLVPELNTSDIETIAIDGKIPIHDKWLTQISNNTLAIDSLLTLGGLESFKADQAELDNRVKRLLEE